MGAGIADIDDTARDKAARDRAAKDLTAKGLTAKDLAAKGLAAKDAAAAAAGQRIDRIENSASGASPAAQDAAQDVEDRVPERQAAEPPSFNELKAAARDLKQRIDDEKRKHDMPVNSSLGDPEVDARNADGRNDLPDDDDA